MAQTASERAALGYRAMSSGLTKPIDVSVAERAQREETRQKERAEDQRIDLMKNIGSLYEHDLVPSYAKKVDREVESLRDAFYNGEASVADVYSGIGKIKSNINDYKFQSDDIRNMSKMIDTTYRINPQTGELMEGGELAQYTSDLGTRDMTDDEFQSFHAGNIGGHGLLNKPTQSSQQIAVGQMPKFFELYAKQGGTGLEDLQQKVSRGQVASVQEVVSQLDPTGKQLFIDMMKQNPEFQNAIQYEYLSTPKDTRRGVDEFVDNRLSGVTDVVQTETDFNVRNLPSQWLEGMGYGKEEADKYSQVINPIEMTSIVQDGKALWENIGEQAAFPELKANLDANDKDMFEEFATNSEQVNQWQITPAPGQKMESIEMWGEVKPDRVFFNEKGEAFLLGYKEEKTTETRETDEGDERVTTSENKPVLKKLQPGDTKKIVQRYAVEGFDKYLQQQGGASNAPVNTQIVTEESGFWNE